MSVKSGAIAKAQMSAKGASHLDKAGFLNRSLDLEQEEERYTDVKALGAGNFGKVTLVLDSRTGAHRVRKTMDTAAMDAQTIALLRSEIEALALLDSPHIVRIFEHAEGDGTLEIIEETLPGGDLLQLIKKSGPLKEEVAARLTRQILVGVAYAHTRGILHRDIKPDNIMLTSSSVSKADAKLIDFGFACIFDAGQDLVSSVVCGTPAYMPPEVLGIATGASANYTEEFDVYSVGATVFEMLTGTKPFGEPEQVEGDLITRLTTFRETVLSTPLPRMRVKSMWGTTELSEDAQEFVEMLMALDPEERGTAMASILHAWITEHTESHSLSAAAAAQVKSGFIGYRDSPYAVKACLLLIASQLGEEELGQYSRAFNDLDTNGDGFVSLDEIAEHIYDDDEQQAAKFLAAADLNGNGILDYTEFVAATLYRELDGPSARELANRAFVSMDTDGDGYVSREDIEELIGDSSLDVHAEVESLLEGMGDDVITAAQFREVMLRTHAGPQGFWRKVGPPSIFSCCSEEAVTLQGEIAVR